MCEHAFVELASRLLTRWVALAEEAQVVLIAYVEVDPRTSPAGVLRQTRGV